MTQEERERYSRQILFSQFGEPGQTRLLQSSAAIVGCGALGSFQAGALARAGIGRLKIIDRDYIEASNLQRQWLFEESDAAEALPKAVAAARAIGRINSAVEVDAAVSDLTPSNAEELLEGVDIILDGTDNFETRYLLNDFAVSEGLPWIYGGAVGSYGIVMPILPGHACFRCVYPDPPSGAQPTCDTVGVLAAVTAAVASFQVAIAMKILSSSTVEPKITSFDIWNGGMRQIAQPDLDPECPACAKRRFEWLEGCRAAPISLCGRNAVQIHERTKPLDLSDLHARLSSLGSVRSNEFGLRFFCDPYEMTIFPDGRAIIKGTTDTGVARGLYAKYVGA